MRVLCLFLLMAVAGCGGGHQDAEIERSSIWDTFSGALSDELRGEPSAESLRKTQGFSRAGVSFQYPSLLRVRVEEDSYPSWSFSRGEFEFELHTPDSTVNAEGYLKALATMFDAVEPSSRAKGLPNRVEWCGKSIVAVVAHVKILGDHYRYQGFDLPDGDSGPRFLIFNDMLQNGHWSATAQASFAAVSASIECQLPATAG